MMKKPQKTDLQQEDRHPRAYGTMMLAAKEEVEKEKGRQTASASCVAKRAISRRIAPTGTCRDEDSVKLLVEHLAVPEGYSKG